MILADARWCGQHGIGRFASEVLLRIGAYTAISDTVPLLHPLEAVWLSLTVKCIKPAVYFSPGFNPPKWSGCPLVFVIHDLIHLKMKSETSLLKQMYYERIVKPAVRRASRVLTVSEFSKAELLEWAGISADQVLVVGNGVSKAFHRKGARPGPDRPYFLFVGSRKPHKNLARVLQAFARSGLAGGMRLLLTGDPDRETAAAAAELQIAASVVFIGSVPDQELASYYRGAVALLAPSLYEGFCIPAIEAGACGCPVLAAAGAQKEVLGDAALFVDPRRVDEITSAMLELAAGGMREALAARGLQRSAQYSWDTTAAKVRGALEDAVPGGRQLDAVRMFA